MDSFLGSFHNIHINPVDAVVVTILLLSALFAILRGLVAELFSVLAWIGAWIAMTAAAPHILPVVEKHVRPEALADGLVYVLLFVTALVALGMIGRAIAGRVRGAGLGALDRSLGAVFGLMRGGFIVCLAYLFASMILPRAEMPDWIRTAKLLPAIERGAGLLKGFFPKGSLIHDSGHEQNAGLRPSEQAMVE